MSNATTGHHPIAPDAQWIAQRVQLLALEKELTQLRDKVAAERRALPWRRIEKPYLFQTKQGPRALAELFGGYRQLVVQHFMFGPGWEQGCPSCSYMADHADGMTVHLAARDTHFLAVSRASLAEIEGFRARMGWKFDWVSSHGSDFNYDFAVSFTPEALATGEVDYNYRRGYFPAEEAPGLSVFVRDDAGEVFHAYSAFGRGVEVMMGTYAMLDLTPLGRQERDTFYKMEWVRHHDHYEPQHGFEPAPESASQPVADCPHCES